MYHHTKIIKKILTSKYICSRKQTTNHPVPCSVTVSSSVPLTTITFNSKLLCKIINNYTGYRVKIDNKLNRKKITNSNCKQIIYKMPNQY